MKFISILLSLLIAEIFLKILSHSYENNKDDDEDDKDDEAGGKNRQSWEKSTQELRVPVYGNTE